MFSEPDDPAVRKRMRTAFAGAAARLDCTPETGSTAAWGHNGRTLGAPVNAPANVSDRAWLRVMEAPADKAGGKLWTGTAQAETVLPAAIPRPRLLHSADWTRDGYAYRAELSAYVSAPVCSRSPDLTEHIALPDAWWSRLRHACDTVTTTPAPKDRQPVITQNYVHRAIPRYLNDAETDTTVRRWSLAHGDLHWANLTSPELTILDWEGFGPAPYGFDAAHLHAYTLPIPELAARVRETFADVLATPQGRLAELTVAAILLQAAERDPVHARLAPLVQAHANHLLASPLCHRQGSSSR